MKLSIKDQAELRCGKCGRQIVIKSEDTLYEAEATQMRSMGPEIQHTLWYNGECPFCKLVYYFNIDAFEYPDGLINFVDYDTNGATWWHSKKPTIIDENGNNVEKCELL